MDTCGKVLAIAGASFLAGAAVNSYVEHRNMEHEAANRRQRKLEDRVIDQQNEIDRLKRANREIVDRLDKGED